MIACTNPIQHFFLLYKNLNIHQSFPYVEIMYIYVMEYYLENKTGVL